MTDLIGKRLGDFDVLRALGRGGMGVVYEAQQVSLNRRVALKVLGAGLGLTDRAVQRFRREAEVAAKLHHTNIVPVYTTGEQDGTHFYAMELIDGPSLDAVIRQLREGQGADTGTAPPADAAATGPYVPATATPPPSSSGSSSGGGSAADRFDRAAAMIADVADALHHAHQNGVTHRDIKPSNLLLSSDGRLSVTDFGLARVLERPGMTVTGEFVGTPAYMSPEQVTAGRVPVDHRTDIYSLGTTLYELLTLRPPFVADGRDKLLALITQKEPPALRSLEPKVPRDLETICLKCLEKDPDRRYQSAKELADDLRRYVHRFAIRAKRAGLVGRAMKWVKRHPGVVALLGCLVAALLVAGFFAFQAKQDRDQLRAEQRQAAVDKAILEALSGDPPAALQAIAEAENRGAEPGQLNLLRGLVEYHRGRPKEAVVYLEQADQQLPDSVAVKALLSSAYVRYGAMFPLLERLEPKTPEDHLFLGLFLAESDPARGLRAVDEAPARCRQSPVGRLVRGMVQNSLALKTGTVGDAEQTLDDLLKVDLPDNPLLLRMRVQAYLVAAHAYGPKDRRRQQPMKQAAGDVQRLAGHHGNAMAVLGCCYYYFVLGDDESLLAAARQAREEGIESPWVTDLEVGVLYGQGKFGDALDALQTGKYPSDASFPLMERGIILAAMGNRKDAAKAMTEAIDSCKGGLPLSFIASYLQLLGTEYREKARQASRQIVKEFSQRVTPWRDRWYHHLLAFNAEMMNATQLLENAGKDHFNLCEAHFYIGLRRLAEGKRTEAKACFQSAMDAGIFYYYEHIWSRAFLAHIDDQDWLPWVPLEK
jgi:tetratricopeptide (TPR) repeat protein